MKKLFLLFCIVMSVTLIGQNKAPKLEVLKKAEKPKFVEHQTNAVIDASRYQKPRGTRNFDKIPFSSSGNVYGILYTDGPLYSNADLNLVSFAHRGGGNYGESGNNIRSKWSTNLGLGWDSVTWVASNGQAHRYPVNCWHNPQGNTNINNAYVLATGPTHLSGTWNYNFLNVAKGDKTGIFETLRPIPADTFMPYYDGLMCYDGIAHVSASVSDLYNSDFGGYSVLKGNFNTGTGNFDWNQEVRINNLWAIQYFSNGTANACFNPSTTWSRDGVNGYFYCVGRDSIDCPSDAQQLYIWTTNNSGATWVKQPAYNFANDATLRDYIWPTLASWDANNPQNWIYRPVFPGGSTVNEGRIPAAVDYLGRLHVVVQIEGAYSAHPDSSDYTYANHPRMFFDIVFDKSNGTYTAFHITNVASKVVDGDNSGYGTGTDAVGWDHRFNATITKDGKKVFYTWTDSDSSLSEFNLAPDLFGKGWDIENNTYTDVINFTIGTIFEADNYFSHAGREVLNGTTPNKYIIPVTTTTIGPTPLDPIVHNYFDGIYFQDSDFRNSNTTQVLTQPRDTVGCIGGSVQFNIQATGPSPSYQWQASPGLGIWNNLSNNTEVSGATTNTLTLSNLTNNVNGFKFRCILTTISDSITSTEAQLSIFSNPVITSVASEDTVCYGQLTTLTGQGGATYIWSGGVQNAVPFAPSASTTYSVTGTDSHGCKNTATQNITVFSRPTVTANASANSVCLGGMVALTGSGANTYEWSNSVNNGQPFAPSTTTTYTVTGSTTQGCSNTAQITILVNNPPVANAGNNFEICNGSSASIIASGGDYYSWSSGQTTANITVLPNTTTTYTVTVSNQCGFSTDEVTVTVSSVATANAGSDVTICSGDFVQLSASGGVLYQWSNTQQSPNITVNPSATATYTVTATSSCGSATDDVTVWVNPVPTSTFYSSSSQACVSSPVTITYTGTASSGASYAWNFNGGTANPGYGAGPHNVYWNFAGTYEVSLVVTENSCTSSLYQYYVTVNVCTDIDENEVNGIIIYPNPARESVSITGVSSPYTLSLYSFDGKLVKMIDITASGNSQTIDLSGVSKGLYTISIQSNYNTINRKISIE